MQKHGRKLLSYANNPEYVVDVYIEYTGTFGLIVLVAVISLPLSGLLGVIMCGIVVSVRLQLGLIVVACYLLIA